MPSFLTHSKYASPSALVPAKVGAMDARSRRNDRMNLIMASVVYADPPPARAVLDEI